MFVPVPGLGDANNAGKDAGLDKIDVGKAVEMWMEKMPKYNKVMSFMCPIEAAKRNIYTLEHGKFNYY